MKCGRTMLMVVALTCLAGTARAGEEVQKEDLSGCKLGHGELVIPDRNAAEAKGGYILRFSDGTLNQSPLKPGERPKSVADYVALMVKEKSGDMIYSSLEGGSLVAVSGRAVDLGKKFLYELSGVELKRPERVESATERSGAGEATPGMIERLQEGHCYLIETAEGKFAVVRMVQMRGRLALMQYVYQPGDKPAFEIPKGELTGVAGEASSQKAETGSVSRGEERAVVKHMEWIAGVIKEAHGTNQGMTRTDLPTERAAGIHAEWIAGVRKELAGIKVGMTRGDLLKVCTTEGGLSTRSQRTYVHKECGTIKVDVTFKAVGDPEEKLKEHEADEIVEISKPYLQYAVMD